MKRTADQIETRDEYNGNGYTPEVMEDFRNKKSCNFQNNKTLLDRAIGILALPYDLNFDMSRRLFKAIAKEYTTAIVTNYGSLLNDEDKNTLAECGKVVLHDFKLQ